MRLGENFGNWNAFMKGKTTNECRNKLSVRSSFSLFECVNLKNTQNVEFMHSCYCVGSMAQQTTCKELMSEVCTYGDRLNLWKQILSLDLDLSFLCLTIRWRQWSCELFLTIPISSTNGEHITNIISCLRKFFSI